MTDRGAGAAHSPGLTVDRSCKARRGGQCTLCSGPVLIGQRIGRIRGTGWAHVACVIAVRVAELAELRGLMTEPPRQGRSGGQGDEATTGRRPA